MFVDKFNFHNYDSLLQVSSKTDPRRRKSDHKELEITSIMYAAHAGALSSMQRYLMSGIDLSQCNYDGRTALHIAAAEGVCVCDEAIVCTVHSLHPLLQLPKVY